MPVQKEYPHRRFNPLTGEWVLVSPHRMKRPWQGKVEEVTTSIRPQYDPKCYLCPGNERAGEYRNEAYESTFVFDNDFAAILEESHHQESKNSLLRSENIVGVSRVICYSPRHDLSLAELDTESIKKVIELWIDQSSELGEKYQWVQIFENKGEIMGCSNPHPHGQIWASNSLPSEPFKENKEQLNYYLENHSVLLLDYLKLELNQKERIIIENEDWVVLVPYWACWPFETMLLPKRHIKRLVELTDIEKESLSEILKNQLVKYDNLFETSFPYTMGWHGAPFNDKDNDHWQLHAHFYPPLLRSATVKKFMVGYELLAEAQRDITAEKTASKLRSLSNNHYSNRF